MKKILINIFYVLFVSAVLYFLGREFAHNWLRIKSFSFSFNLPLLALASLTYIATLFCFSYGWRVILLFLGFTLPLFETVMYFFITQPAKYIPGKIWIGVARMKFCKKHEVPHSVTFVSTVIEAVMEILAGTYVSLFALLQTETFDKYTILSSAGLSALGLLLLLPRVFYFFINLYLRLAKKKLIPKNEYFPMRKLILMQLIFILGLVGIGVSQLLFLLALTPVDPSYFPYLISIGSLTYIASVLAVFTPSGLGVREGIWFIALKKILTRHITLVYVFASRVWMIMIELILMAAGMAALKIQKMRLRNL